MRICLLVLFLGLDTVTAQEPLPPAPELTLPAASQMPITPGAATLSHPQDRLIPAVTGYWRIGTRQSGQHFGTGICNCPLTVEQSDDCGRCFRSNEQTLLASIRPAVPVCIVVHGSMVDEAGSRTDSLATYRWLKRCIGSQPVHLIFFDWPSEKKLLLPCLDLGMLGSQAARNGFPLARFIGRLPAGTPVCLLGHSHGARLIVATAHLMNGGTVQGRRLAWRDHQHRLRLVLAAAAFDRDWLNPGQRYDRALCRAECLVNLQNRYDYALKLYPLRKPFSPRALGQTGLSSRDLQRLGANARRFHAVDVSPLVGREHMWPWYYRQPRIAGAIAPTILFAN